MSQVVVEMSGQEHRLWQSMNKVIIQQDRMEDKFRKSGKTGTRMMDQLSTGAAGLVTRFLSVGAAVGLVTAAMQDAIRISKEAGQRVMSVEDATRRLLQISSGRPEEFAKLKAIAQQVRTQEGIPEEEAKKLVFSAQSAGLVGDSTLFASLRNIGMNPESGISATQILQGVFGGAGSGDTGGGSSRQIINKLLAAAARSPVGAEQIAVAASTAASAFQMIGGQDEELLALQSTLSTVSKSPEAAAERIKSLASQLVVKRARINFRGMDELSGMALIDALPDLAQQGRLRSEGGERQTLEKFLAEANALEAMSKIQQLRPQIDTVLSEIRQAEQTTGGRGDLLSQMRGIGMADPMLAQSRNVRQSLEEANLANETREGIANLVLEQRRNFIDENHSGLGRYLMQTDLWLRERMAIGGTPTIARNLLRESNPLLGMSPEEALPILRALENIDNKLGEIRDSNRSMDMKTNNESARPIRNPRDPALMDEGTRNAAAILGTR